MKVDTNTRGNTYWFMFKVKNFRVNQKYTFTIMNFTRSMDTFYSQRMNIVTKAEKIPSLNMNDINSNSCTSSNPTTENTENAEWRYNTCHNINWSDYSDIDRQFMAKENEASYARLSF